MNSRFILGLLLVGILLAGCINLGGPAAPQEQTPTQEQPTPEVKRPSLNILTPLEDAVIKTEGDFTDVEVTIETSDLVVKTPGGKNKVGEGSFYYMIDGVNGMASVNKKVTFPKVAVGEHTLTVEIKQNDQSSYFPKIVKSVTFKVEKISTEYVPKTYTVNMKNMAYNPAQITVHVGDSITWANEDSMPHTATSTGNFNTDTIPSGQSKTVTFTKAGTFDYFCIVHPNMKGIVVVQE
jgi:plastocyanin